MHMGDILNNFEAIIVANAVLTRGAALQTRQPHHILPTWKLALLVQKLT